MSGPNEMPEGLRGLLKDVGREMVSARATELLLLTSAAAEAKVNILSVTAVRSKEDAKDAAMVMVLGGEIPDDILASIAKFIEATVQDLHAGNPDAPKVHSMGIHKESDTDASE